jgi:adenine-specific DNA-methyltransferase
MMSDSRDQLDNGVISNWAHQLGLAASPLFGLQESNARGSHFALLDGRRGSFACSLVTRPDIAVSDSRNWQWSADLAHHVLLTPDEVVIRSGSDPTSRRFHRATVDLRLDEFHAFLDSSRGGLLPDVVPFLVDEFLQLWSVMPGDPPQGLSALGAFLLALQAAGEADPSVMEDQDWRRKQAVLLGLESVSLEDLGTPVIQRAVGLQERAPLGLKLIPGLVLRHAAGRLFQEAHAYLEAAQLGLWGDAVVRTVPTLSPTGAYFTPVPMARLLAESALQAWPVLPEKLVVADFACGSAVFLCEALRELERRDYRGNVRLIGRDISPEAVTMAKVAIATTVRDLIHMKVDVDVEEMDVLHLSTWPQADVVLMNPPFRSWEHMADHERQWVREAMLQTHRGRPDLSVGFVEHALRALRPGGVLATLLPAGVLASEGLAKWRDGLAERSAPRLIAVLGEHGLFRHAFVNVGILVLEKESVPPQKNHLERRLNVAWASPDAGAASEAIRALRRLVYLPSERPPNTTAFASWTVTRLSLGAWNERVSWLPGPGVLGSLLDVLKDRLSTRVEDLFNVRQGIRTGAKDIFVLTKDAVDALPKAERRYFKPAVDSASFVEGEILPHTCLFVPDPAWHSEDEVAAALPEFFKSRLRPSRNILQGRKGIDSDRWWQLTRARGWAFEGSPRLVSKRFGLYPAFARDKEGQLAIVQANAWAPTKKLSEGLPSDLEGILTAYWWLLNSRVMVALFREYCPNVAGGQLDLERKYVRHVPLPNLVERLREDSGLQSQAMAMRMSYSLALPPIAERDRFAATAFGTSLEDWPIAG